MNERLRNFQPYTPSHSHTKELSFRAILIGILLGFFFAVGNAYLGLKTGTTISASIPAAIISMGLFRTFFKRSSILENNIVQTIATVGEGIASGVIFTIPALIFLGESPSLFRIFLLSALGGILGILFMIPMRRYVIVQEHGILPFPEGTACAEILKAGENASASASVAIWGFIAAVGFKLCTSILYLWEETPKWILPFFQKTEFSIDASPSLLGIGYIIGPKISSYMFMGGALSWWVIIPLIHIFGVSDNIIYPSTIPVAQMSAEDIWANYVRYIGAGAVAMGGLLSLFRIAPLIKKTVLMGFKELFGGLQERKHLERTDRDISLAWLIIGSISIILALWVIPATSMNLFTILLLVLLAFFFVGVTSLTVGLVGSSSNPTSGMTITTLLLTCIIFVSIGWTEKMYLITAISMSCVANVAISMAGTTAQDLKTGFLLGATPKWQQIAEIIGIIIPSLTLGTTLYILNEAYGLGSSQLPAPQATLMTLIAKGVISGDLPFSLVAIGMVIGFCISLLRIPILPVAIGLYLPLSLSSAIMIGGLVAHIHHRSGAIEAKEKGILISSGLVGGDACSGVIIALLTIGGVISVEEKPLFPALFSLVAYLLFAGLFLLSLRTKNSSVPPEGK